MKITQGGKFFFLLLLMLASGHLFAQDTLSNDTLKPTEDTLPESAYKVIMPEHTATVYNTPIPSILFGILFLLMIFVAYRYWNDNRRRDTTSDDAGNSGAQS